ncbi:MAG TPA: acyl-CoA dehydratase activase-related protein [Bacillota bacterium]|jgi:predicted nucleotide-binding protein (sugar kinase/HSP70/actin superfamily)
MVTDVARRRPIRVGVPRALLYHEYAALWTAFLAGLGLEVVVSDPTSKSIVDAGVKEAVDEACLPVKVFYGHVIDLRRKGVDYIFLPRVVAVERRAYSCPKLLGLPDMIRHTVKPLPPLIDETVNVARKPRQIYGALWRATAPFTRNPWTLARAWRRALRAHRDYRERLLAGWIPGGGKAGDRGGTESPGVHDGDPSDRLTIGVLGHPYNVYDRHISLDLLGRLERWGVRVVTADSVPTEVARAETDRLPKDLFWSTGRKILGSGLHYLNSRSVDGLIHLVSFGCGPDSLVGELVQRKAARLGTVPFLLLTLDEHSGEAGLVTRIEAFMDMVRQQRRAGGGPVGEGGNVG